jgi:enamine deaminase RidA (YjgF/YER057c/UK114 family)
LSLEDLGAIIPDMGEFISFRFFFRLQEPDMLERIITQPDPYEPFLLSQGIRFGDLLFISGQAGAGDDGRIVDGGFLAQGEQAFANLRRALEAGGSSLRDVIKVTIFVTDMGHFQDVVALRRKFFSAPYPADTIAEIKALYDPRAMIEIEAIAAVRRQGDSDAR